MATVGQDGDVIINGVPYIIDLPSYQRRDIVDFSPRSAGPAGASIAYSELGLHQNLTQEDWRHGIGFQRFTDAMGYLRTEGDVDTRHKGIVMRASQKNESDTTNAIKDGALNWTGEWFSWSSADGIRRFSGGNGWSATYSTAVNWALSNGSYMFICPNGARIQKSTTGQSGSWSNAGLNSTASDFGRLTIHGGYVWAVEDGNNNVHYGSDNELDDLEGGGTADTNVVKVGPGDEPVVNMASFGVALYAARRDGLWVVNQDTKFNARQVLSFASELHDNNFKSLVVFQGALYFPIRHRIYRWTGNSLIDITPDRLTDTFEFVQYGQFQHLVTRGGFLYCVARTNETTYTESILCYDGVGWHRVHDVLTDGVGTVSMMGIDTTNDYLWYHLDVASDKTYYIKMQALSDLPSSDFATSGNHYLFPSRHDMGFKRVQKSASEMLFETDMCDSTHAIRVEYRKDTSAESWTSLGTVTNSPQQTLSWSNSLEFYGLDLRLNFSTASSTGSPILHSYNLKYMMRPEVAYGYTFDVIAAPEHEYGGSPQPLTPATVMSNLETARDSKAPVTFVNLMGQSKNVYVSAILEVARERFDDNNVNPTIEHVVQVSLVEVG